MSLCIAAGGVVTALAWQAFTLEWTHSIEKILWEEDYQIEGSTLRLIRARIRGSGAGMEVPDDARLVDGVWHYTPALAPLERLHLTHSPYAEGYRVRHDGECAPLTRYAPAVQEDDVIEVYVCTLPPGRHDLAAAGDEA